MDKGEAIGIHITSDKGVRVRRVFPCFEIPHWMLDKNGNPLPQHSWIKDLPGWKRD